MSFFVIVTRLQISSKGTIRSICLVGIMHLSTVGLCDSELRQDEPTNKHLGFESKRHVSFDVVIALNFHEHT